MMSQLAFLSDVDFPNLVPGSAGYYFVKYFEQVAPEFGEYTTILDLAPADSTLRVHPDPAPLITFVAGRAMRTGLRQ